MTEEEMSNAMDDVMRFLGPEVHRLFSHIISTVFPVVPTITEDTTDDTVEVPVNRRNKGNS